MKANEFIKKYGWSDARFYLSTASDDAIWISFDMPEHGIDNIILYVSELKHLVESHELIESFGGLDLARKEAHKNCFEFNAPLLKAIYDVESCQ